ncbi:MAG: HAMP domain-containing sensor histidine kinase, partial [Planctomycetota bacterium]
VVAPEISVLGRKKYLQVALLFILKNARDALIGNPFGRIHIDVTTDNESVFVDIRDNGVGMTDAELTRCIQPGFSSKPPGEGSGLGLSAAYSIIASHGGRLTLQSEKGKGTTCRVELPSKK